jgi:hypothetical protein
MSPRPRGRNGDVPFPSFRVRNGAGSRQRARLPLRAAAEARLEDVWERSGRTTSPALTMAHDAPGLHLVSANQ